MKEDILAVDEIFKHCKQRTQYELNKVEQLTKARAFQLFYKKKPDLHTLSIEQ